jgi:hypothetical protein
MIGREGVNSGDEARGSKFIHWATCIFHLRDAF